MALNYRKTYSMEYFARKGVCRRAEIFRGLLRGKYSLIYTKVPYYRVFALDNKDLEQILQRLVAHCAFECATLNWSYNEPYD